MLCRNLVFTYLVEEAQARILEGIADRMAPGGALVIGAQEELPPGRWPLRKAHPSHLIDRVGP